MYQLIYDFFKTHVFNMNDNDFLNKGFVFQIGYDNFTTTPATYFSHLCTIACMIALFILACFFIRWVVRVFAGLFNRI